jgi:hypothetical protein
VDVKQLRKLQFGEGGLDLFLLAGAEAINALVKTFYQLQVDQHLREVKEAQGAELPPLVGGKIHFQKFGGTLVVSECLDEDLLFRPSPARESGEGRM